MYTRQERRASSTRAMAALAAVLPATQRPEVVRDTATGRSLVILAGTTVDVVWLERGWPREVRQALRSATPDVVAAPTLSPGARRLLEESGTSWVDEGGDASIDLGGLVVVRRSVPAREGRSGPSRWSPTLLAVCEALLVGTPGTGHAVSRATGLSLAGCLTALKRLTEEGLLVSAADRGPGSARTVKDADALLDHYVRAARASTAPPSLTVGVLWRDPLHAVSELGSRWDEQGVDWAVDSALAAAVLAPVQTSPSPWEVCVGVTTRAELDRLAATSGLRVVEGGRLTLRPFPTAGTRALSARAPSGVRAVPWPRAYVGLLGRGVRGDEAADALREAAGRG